MNSKDADFMAKYTTYWDAKTNYDACKSNHETLMWLWRKQQKRRWIYMAIYLPLFIVAVITHVKLGTPSVWYWIQLGFFNVANILCVFDWGKYRKRLKANFADMSWYLRDMQSLGQEMKTIYEDNS